MSTPEKWHFEGSFDTEVGVAILTQDGETVAEIEPYTESWTQTEIDRVRLMSAAPDLLAALKRIVDHFGDPLRVARSAIAKAEGL